MTTETDAWANEALHNALVSFFPIYVKEPFSEAPKLDVPKFHKAIGLSYETVYKWLRNERRINPRNAKEMVSVANRPDNVNVLTTLGRTPPTTQDFAPFVFA